MIQELPGLLVEDPLGDVYKTPTREEISKNHSQVIRDVCQKVEG